jgi:sugar (pentulose or hexulose) kinase
LEAQTFIFFIFPEIPERLSKQPVTLIFDIGKTTKKVLVFDKEFQVLVEQTEVFEETVDDDGFASENLPALSAWVMDRLREFLSEQKFAVTHINFSTYGASLVNLDHDDQPIKFFYNYLKPFPEDCKQEFLEKYDADHNLLAATASPFLGLLNSGLQLVWLKQKKQALFSQIKTSLHFPQFFPYLLTKQKFSDITSVGCHTMLWDFQKHDYHHWVDHEGLRKLFPPVHHADQTVGYTHNGTNIKVGIGVHDSSAALMPYLVVMKEKFLLLSTGTWNICFNPFNNQLLSQNELRQDCLCYFTFDGRPVKASRIFLGHEHELQQRALASYFKVDPDHYKMIEFDQKLYDQCINISFTDFTPLGMEGTGPTLPSSPAATDYSRFKTFEEAQHHLIYQLVRWQKISIDLIDPKNEIKNLILVGGFTKSNLFPEIMKRALPERKILTSDHPRATALGAAWLVVGKDAYSHQTHHIHVLPV